MAKRDKQALLDLRACQHRGQGGFAGAALRSQFPKRPLFYCLAPARLLRWRRVRPCLGAFLSAGAASETKLGTGIWFLAPTIKLQHRRTRALTRQASRSGRHN